MSHAFDQSDLEAIASIEAFRALSTEDIRKLARITCASRFFWMKQKLCANKSPPRLMRQRRADSDPIAITSSA